MNKKESLDEFNEYIKGCCNCPLSQTRHCMVPGEGNADAKLMFIGEGPGADEDRTGRPFVGKAGQLMDKILASVDIKREDIYIANIIKCRPPGNRNPLPLEIERCLPFLRKQVSIIKPKIIVCLGSVAYRTIINPKGYISKERGLWIERKGYHMMGTYHPAALLRDETKKRDVWVDIQAIKKKLSEIE